MRGSTSPSRRGRAAAAALRTHDRFSACQPVAPNLPERDFNASAPNQKWVADITYVDTAEGHSKLEAIGCPKRYIAGEINQTRIAP